LEESLVPVVTDEQLMLEVRAGSREAFETLFERYRGPVWRFFRRRVEAMPRAEELAHDVFVAILQNAARYEPRSAFRSYLFGIAYNALMAERRTAAHRTAEPLPADLPGATPDPDAALWVRGALATLEPADREKRSKNSMPTGRTWSGASPMPL
jgi:RNA polymerase sigma factor (sigma-70 family)